MLALVEGDGGVSRPVKIEVSDAARLEPGLLLFATFLGGWLAQRDRNNDGGL